MQELRELHKLILNGTASNEEVAEWRRLLRKPENELTAREIFKDVYKMPALADLSAEEAQTVLQQIVSIKNTEYPVKGESPVKSVVTHRIHFLRTAWFRSKPSHVVLRWTKYAAAILLVIGVAAYFFISKQNVEKPAIVQQQNKQPGKDRAILTLSDGRQVVLDNSDNQNISDGNISIGNANGILSYSNVPASETNSSVINIMATPRGGQYQLVLPDGSRVWLNSASSLKYPTVFTGRERWVELSGEAYFEIKGNKKMPFIVKTKKGEVLVLGTTFNINSYADEPEFSTTLISGSVKVSSGKDAKTISPGQQATILNSSPDMLRINENVDINQVTAWQKGIFQLNGVSLDVIARQLSRWYDVDVKTSEVYNKNFRFSGGIAKKTPLNTLLAILEANGVKNRWENNFIILYTN